MEMCSLEASVVTNVIFSALYCLHVLILLNIACNEGSIRLVGGTLPNEGRIEVCLNRRWGTVCSAGFFNVDARVACRQLGYSVHSKRAHLN